MKLRFLFLLVILLTWKAPDLLAQERRGSENETITAEQYCAFLNAEQAVDCRLQTTGSEEATNHSDRFLGTITACNLNDFYDERMQGGSIMRAGLPGNYCYNLISTASTDSFNSCMAGLSWNDAARYCDWKNHSASTYNLNSCAISAANVDPSLKSNVLTFRLVSTEMTGNQVGEVEVATMCSDLVDDLLEITFGLVGLGACRSGSPEELRSGNDFNAESQHRAAIDRVPEGFWLHSAPVSQDRIDLSNLFQSKETCTARKENPSIDFMNKVGEKAFEFPLILEEKNSEVALKGPGKRVAFGDKVFVQVISKDQVPFETAVQEIPFSDKMEKFVQEEGVSESKESQRLPKSEAKQQWRKCEKVSLHGWKRIQCKCDAILEDEQIDASAKKTAIAAVYERNYSTIKSLLRSAFSLIKENSELQTPKKLRVLVDIGKKVLMTATYSVSSENLRPSSKEESDIQTKGFDICKRFDESMDFLRLSDDEIVEKKKKEAQQDFKAITNELVAVMEKREKAWEKKGEDTFSELSAQIYLERKAVSSSLKESKKRLDAVKQRDPKIVADEARKIVIDNILSIIETVEQTAENLHAMRLSRKIK